MPRLWSETIETHRHAVRDAILDAAAALVAQHGPASVRMSQVATEAGIGRATLYKYFPDLDAMLVAWHERHVAAHVEHLTAISERAGSPAERLRAVLEASAHLRSHRQDGVAVRLHRGPHVQQAERALHDLVTGLLTDAVASGDVRDDTPPAELAGFCLHALDALRTPGDPGAAQRLIGVIIDGLRPQPTR